MFLSFLFLGRQFVPNRSQLMRVLYHESAPLEGKPLPQRRKPLISLVGNLSFRGNLRVSSKAYADFQRQRGNLHDAA